MENFALIALAENLRPMMAGLIIRRIVQHQPNGFIFHTRSAALPALKIVLNASGPALYPSESRPPLEGPGSDFLMILRKHFTSAELVEFHKPLSERIVELVFKTAVPSKELETMSLVLELIPNAPNLILLDAQRRILFSLLPLTPQHGIGEFEPYAFPRSGDRMGLERVVAEDVAELSGTDEALAADPAAAGAWLLSRVAGMGPVFAAEIVFRQRRSGRLLAAEIRDLIQQSETSSHSARLYTEKPLGHLLDQNDLRGLGRAILSPVELLSLERTHSNRVFGNIAEAARFYFDEIESRTLLETEKLPLLRNLRIASKRLEDRGKRLARDQKGYENAEKLQKTAQLLTSSGKKPDQRYEAVTVTDYFGEKSEEVRVELDPSMTLRENIDRMFKRYQKAGRGLQMAARQIADVRSREAAVREQIRRLQAIKDWDTWLAIAGQIEKRQQSGDGPPALAAAARRHRSIVVDGREILIGRSGKENDELTFRTAAPEDFWLHVAEYSGSHVVVRNPSREKELPAGVLLKAAQLAAFYSQARNSSKVEVHYTQRKNVSKPRRAKPGLVKLSEFKSIAVEPRNWLEA